MNDLISPFPHFQKVFPLPVTEISAPSLELTPSGTKPNKSPTQPPLLPQEEAAPEEEEVHLRIAWQYRRYLKDKQNADASAALARPSTRSSSSRFVHCRA